MRRTHSSRARQASILDAYNKWWPLTFTSESLAWTTLYRIKGTEAPRMGLRDRALQGPVEANGGTIEVVNGELVFVFQEAILGRLIEVFGNDVPAMVPAEPVVCIPLPPIIPTVGGFIDPDTGRYCRPEAVIPAWDRAVRGDLDAEFPSQNDLSGAHIGQKPPPPPGVCCQLTPDGGSVCSNGLVYNPG